MPTDFLSSYGATRDLDRELGFGLPSVGYNDPQLSGRQVSNYGGQPSYSGNVTSDELYGISNRRGQQQLAQQDQQQRAIQTYNSDPRSSFGPSPGGYAKSSFSNYLNPQAISGIYAAQRQQNPVTQARTQQYPEPARRDYLGRTDVFGRPDTADYSTAGQNQSDKPLTDVQRYGGTWQGGRWVANRPGV